MAKDKYEISLWDDIFVSASGNVPGHYEEQKIAVIGSDTMTTYCRAIEPKLTRNINGKNTFTFKMFYTYHDELTGEDYQNPFLNLLVNERKVKVKWQNEWYDLIIKNIQEASNGKSITYTCEDANINELAKSGFEIVFDDELNDEEFTNQGTAQELVARTLQGTDWTVGTSDTIQQANEEPVFEFTLTANLTNVLDETTNTSGQTIPTGSVILVYYSQVQDVYNGETNSKTLSALEFAYASEYKQETNKELVVNSHCYKYSAANSTVVKDGAALKLSIGSSTNQNLVSSAVSTRYRAKRLIESPKMVKDKLSGKTCYVYTAPVNGAGDWSGKISTNDTIYKYIGSDFGTANYVSNLVANGSNFLSTDGWNGNDSHIVGFTVYPITNNALPTSSFLTIPVSNNNYYYNDAMRASSEYFADGVGIKDKYIVRLKVKSNLDGSYVGLTTGSLEIQPQLRTWYIPDGSVYRQPLPTGTSGGVIYTTTSAGTKVGDWIEWTLTCKESFTGANIYSKHIGLFFKILNTSACYIEAAEFFKYITGKDEHGAEVRINPGDFDTTGVVKTVYTYYNFTKASADVNSAENWKEYILYNETTDWDRKINGNNTLTAIVNDNFVKIRSIQAKNSNRFNILQSIAETFQCWIKFDVAHDSTTGRLVYVNGVPQKQVLILNEIGVERGIGFIYGIDLQTISRTIESNSIVTKTIVKPNDNKYGENGICSISRSEFNIPKTNYIYNFDYYINHQLLDGTEYNKDLYLKTGTDEATESQKSDGYYYWMNKWNLEYEANADLISKYQITVTENNARRKAFAGAAEAANDTIISYQRQICNLAGNVELAYTSSTVKTWINKHKDENQVKPILAAIVSQTNLKTNYEGLVSALDNSTVAYLSQIQTLQDRQDLLESYIRAKSAAFYKKYARFISEGSWIDQKYSDDNLYYLDATSVAYTSSRPQVTYNISVLRLTGLEGFELKDFALGDIAFVQDTEFFGYIYEVINNVNVKTPYKELVLISEITYNFDDPSKDSFKVQNYKTQFEDLFQRITATTQSLQFSNGQYAKAAEVVKSDGTINTETLASSIAVNANVLNHTSLNQSVITDEQGITVTDLTDPSKVVRITAGGIFISTDGGNSWKNAVRGEGLSTQYLTAGQLNTSTIQILDGQFAAFRWDEHGISAYDAVTEDGQIIGYSTGKFVRFDHFGIYGLDDELSDEYSPSTEEQIWDDAKFGMTWKGFFVKNKYGDHYVEVSSENDIAVVDTSGPSAIDRVKIGKLDDNLYGIQLKDSSGNSVMRTDSTGQLWLDNALYVARSSSGYDVAIGALPTTGGHAYAPNSAGAAQVFNATNKFKVYEDGSMTATDAYLDNAYISGHGEFTGAIYATSGKIGNMTIDEVENATYKVVIESNSGTIFRPNSPDKILTANLYKSTELIVDGTKSYQWYCDGNIINAATSSTYTVDKTAFGSNAVHTYDCVITYTPAGG